ncbi:uncharacterized protein KY384_000651 [Bacidia gigantensis]|uniref:uncharacterized protein n=1 Tax=Bacidia gigantensis TaxID=2732470 RepID=UPI001D0563C1|nr:uncharacterized protein KY384_000651 [Bacidia gigantensis]KAG8525891.1 hypothetical protein KY384_000651 [Bacidia gigantensis]
MPLFYHGPVSQSMPLTPPETYGHYIDSAYGSSSFPTSQASVFHKQKPAVFYSARPVEMNGASEQVPQMLPVPVVRPAFFPEDDRQQPSYFAPSQPEATQQAATSASQLQPVRMPKHTINKYHRTSTSKPQQSATKAKEEKIGGVAAYLDYEMGQMTDFVSEMAQGMYDIFVSKIHLADIDMARSVLNSTSTPTREFRKYVLQVLSSTRLPSSTILLGLLYLSKRMVLLSSRGHYIQRSQDVYSMLTIALVLGSKFLDDNTFQNRSWSEVSNISISEINRLEYEWLADIKWDMHIDQGDPDGFRLWLKHWEHFCARRTDVSLATSMDQTHLDSSSPTSAPHSAQNLPPLDTQLIYSRGDDLPRAKVAYADQGIWNTAQYTQWQQSQGRYSPPSASESGPHTPDAYGLLNSYVYGSQIMQDSLKLPSAQGLLPHRQSSDLSLPYTPQYSYYDASYYCQNNSYRLRPEAPYLACA